MASTSSTGVEIQKLDSKNFALWKEMMQDVLIIQYQIEAIRHNNKSAVIVADSHVDHLNAFGRERLLQHGERDNGICLVGEATSVMI